MTATATISPLHGHPYRVEVNGRMIELSRDAPDGRFVHRVIMARRDARQIASALMDAADAIEASVRAERDQYGAQRVPSNATP